MAKTASRSGGALVAEQEKRSLAVRDFPEHRGITPATF